MYRCECYSYYSRDTCTLSLEQWRWNIRLQFEPKRGRRNLHPKSGATPPPGPPLQHSGYETQQQAPPLDYTQLPMPDDVSNWAMMPEFGFIRREGMPELNPSSE